MVCVEEVAKSGKVGRGVTGIDHQCRNPQGRGGCVGGAHRRRRDQSKRGLGGLAAHLGGGFGLLLGSCYSSRARVRQARLFEI